MNILKKNRDMIGNNKIPTDSNISGLTMLFSDNFISSALIEYFKSSNYVINSFSISYLRFKPDTSCIASYNVELYDKISCTESTGYFYAKAYTQNNYELAKEKALGLHYDKKEVDTAVLCFDIEAIIFYPFYADSEIKSLDSLLDARKLRRVIYTHDEMFKNKNIRISHKKMTYQVIRYKPEKRILLKVQTICTNIDTGEKENVSYYMKCDTNGRGKIVADLLNRLSDTNPNVLAPIYYDDEKKSMIFKEVKADDVSSFIDGSEFTNINKMAASLIFDIHTATVNKSISSMAKTSQNNFDSTALSLKHILPESENIVDEILSALHKHASRNIKTRKVLVHGDFSYEQLLYADNKISLLDFDRFSMGDNTEDIGNYIAHLMYKNIFESNFDSDKYIKDFIIAYNKSAGYETDKENINYWIVVSLLQLSIKPFRLFKMNWDTKTKKILEVVLNVVKNEF